MDFRTEKDQLGSLSIHSDAYYGIHTKRALHNFSVANRPVHMDLVHNLVLVKKACAMANKQTGALDSEIATRIIMACDLIIAGEYDDYLITDALQGGAGTSTNMNVNEVIANVALELLGLPKGDYKNIHPLDHVNLSQSTNDVYPTALRITAIYKIRILADHLAALQESLQEKEQLFSDVLKLGRTQLMDALPVTLGQEFGAYAKAISRDRWRIYKAEERLREVGIGGTAVGTGLNATMPYIYLVTDLLKDLTGLGIARSDLLMDTYQNMDVFVEVSGFLKACATNLIKISSDLRLMASGPAGGLDEIRLEPLQAGSSIMPGKVNPVICESVLQAGLKVIGNDAVLTQAAYLGQLELNAFTPLIADTLLESLDLLIRSVDCFDRLCIQTLTANTENCKSHLEKSTALSAALIHHLGYEQTATITLAAKEANMTLRYYLIKHQVMPEATVDLILNPRQVTKPGIPGIS
ncbi:MAG: aspartate ammonia-lyase [Firmicutes bacterium HGW-Firmicutes-3]|jgi:aspartate ammonia-lyase|nr:MAG: aspartate ammonia-lyase [Firmicutes bacterium HGW-Firmicutes-3]